MVVNVRMTKSRRGVPMCFVQLDDRSARIEVSLMGETFDNYAAKVNKDKLLVIEGEVQFNEFSGGSLCAAVVYSILMRRGSVLARD